MYRKLLPALVLITGLSTAAVAQNRNRYSDKNEDITIRRKGDSKEKTTIVIDGDNITVNGKPLSELKDADIQVFRNRNSGSLNRLRDGDGLRDLEGLRNMERLREIGPRGGMKMLDDDFVAGNNRAKLGVASEKNDKGARITSVEDESPAEKAGLKKDDIITKVNDTKVEDSKELYEAIGKYKPEDKVTITYLRDGKEGTASVTLGKNNASLRVFGMNGDNFNFRMPDMDAFRGFNGDNFNFNFGRRPRLGMEIQDVESGKGVKVTDVDDDTPAAKAGLQKGDVISAVNDKSVDSVDDLRSELRSLHEGDSVKVTYQRAGKTQTATLSFPKKLKTAEL